MYGYAYNTTNEINSLRVLIHYCWINLFLNVVFIIRNKKKKKL